MLARLAGVASICLVWVGSAFAAGAPVGALAKAVQRSNDAATSHLGLTERIEVGSRTITTVRIDGLQKPRLEEGLFTYRVSPAQPGLGAATMIVHNTSVYVHYGIFDTAHARNPAVKSWMVINTSSSLGVNPAGLASLSLKEVDELTGLTAAQATDGGVPVTRYRGVLALAKVARSPEIQGLLASIPSAAAALFKGTERLEVSVAADGYIHHVVSRITAPLSGGPSLMIALDVVTSDYGRSSRAIVAPPASKVMTLAEFQQATGSAPSAAGDALLQTIVLRAAQVGAGYKLANIPGGKVVQGETTLDFCNKIYRSESLRVSRLQVVYDAKQSSTQVSNEVVTYQPGGASSALMEVRGAAANCANGRVANPPKGVTDLTRETRIISDPRLLPGSIAILETDTAIVKGKRIRQQTAAIYQVRGNVLSGVYGIGKSLSDVKGITLHAAEQSAADLRRHVSTQTGLPIA